MTPQRPDIAAEHDDNAPGSDRREIVSGDNPIVAFMQRMTPAQWQSIERIQALDDAEPIAAEPDAHG